MPKGSIPTEVRMNGVLLGTWDLMVFSKQVQNVPQISVSTFTLFVHSEFPVPAYKEKKRDASTEVCRGMNRLGKATGTSSLPRIFK